MIIGLGCRLAARPSHRPPSGVLLLAVLLGGCSQAPPPARDPETRPDLRAPDLPRDLRPAEPRPDDLPAARADGRPGAADQRGLDSLAVGPISCASTPPPGAALAAPPPAYSGGTCPSLVAGRNTIMTKGGQREFLLVLPANPQPTERYPLLFMWHWLKSNAESFLTRGEVQAAADQQRLVAVLPESKGDLSLIGLVSLPWPFAIWDSPARLEEEFEFFDDMLACVSTQFPINKECVSSVGVSAGALFTDLLVGVRSQYLSSFISLSGGVGGSGGVNAVLRPFTPPPRKLPALVLWGGPLDHCVLLDFQLASLDLEKQLTAGGHFFLECIHNCQHSIPPLDPLPGESRFASIWDFALRHPFWLPSGLSPYTAIGLPSNLPWCGIGPGSATPRTAPCAPPECPL